MLHQHQESLPLAEVESPPPPAHNHARLQNVADVKRFVLAGNATLTLVSGKTGTRYTYHVKQVKSDAPHFVSVLYGSDNENDLAFIGSIFADGEYRHGRKSKLPAGDIRESAWCYLWRHVLAGNLPADLEIWHEGRCARCGRKLTVPESIERGLGPECAGLV